MRLRGLGKSYGGVAAVQDLSFEVAAGEVFGFIGPNGAGKTTTLRMLATLLEPTAGEAWIDGHSVVDEADLVRRVMGYMPDQVGVYEGITVGEYLEFFASAYRLGGPRRAAVLRDVLELTDLGSLKERMVATLSKGMKQRLCLAKTLIHDPKVLLLDEPASALDPRARIELRALLKELGRMGKTIVISSHILSELSDLCSSIAILESGRLVASGRMDLLNETRVGADRVKITLHAPRPDVDALLAAVPFVGSILVEGARVSFDYGGPPEEFYKVLKALADSQVPVLSVEHDSTSLEAVFLKLTRGDVQ
ncbi:MAG TPA: ABC transporter ATP-binding protein [Planctomycetota bacterium]|nr:ABC transporter ATP-binding protein [Planctomycetota bacterium]